MEPKNTGIRIETIREVNSAGQIGYRVTSIAALSDNQLPPLYLQSHRPVVWQRATGNWDLLIKPAGNKAYTIYLSKSFYTTEETEKRLALIIKAGLHLTEVNAHLVKERAAWSGKVTFVDGVESPPRKRVIAYRAWWENPIPVDKEPDPGAEKQRSEKPDPESESVPARISRL